ncbi:hypothetical protein D3C80_1630590 [compost metagenome]
MVSIVLSIVQSLKTSDNQVSVQADSTQCALSPWYFSRRAICPGASNCALATRMPCSVRSSTNAWAAMVINATQLCGYRAAQCAAIAPPTLWPRAMNRSSCNSVLRIAKKRSASSRMKCSGKSPG